MTHAQLVEAGFAVDAATHARLESFVAGLLDATSRINLTAIRTPERVWQRHVCDSLALLPLLDALGAKRVIDVGTGGGVPGVPLACARPDVHFTLVDSTRKKIEAVRGICAGTGLTNVSFIAERAEALAHLRDHRERYDAATARAVATTATLIEWLSGFVRVGGEVCLLKMAADAPQEIAEAALIAERHALALTREMPYSIPGDDAPRVVIVYRKVGPLQRELPRRGGAKRESPA